MPHLVWTDADVVFAQRTKGDRRMAGPLFQGTGVQSHVLGEEAKDIGVNSVADGSRRHLESTLFRVFFPKRHVRLGDKAEFWLIVNQSLNNLKRLISIAHMQVPFRWRSGRPCADGQDLAGGRAGR